MRMRDTWVDLDVGDEDLGVQEPVAEDRTGVFRRVAPSRLPERTDVFPRANTSEPTRVFARPSSMYPMASADADASMPVRDATVPSNSNDVLDAEAIVRRFDTVPPINARTRVVAKVPRSMSPSSTARRAG